MKRPFFVAALTTAACLSFGCGPDPDDASSGPDERTSPSASGRRVMGIQGLPPGWSKAAVTGEPTAGPGVSAEGSVLTGTPEDDLIVAGRGAQAVRGLGDGNTLSGGEGRDSLHGGPGDNLINAQGDGRRDEIDCGPGRDEVLRAAEDEKRPRHCEFEGAGVE